MNIHQHHRFQEDRHAPDARAFSPDGLAREGLASEGLAGASLTAAWHAGWAAAVTLTALGAPFVPGLVLTPTTQAALLLTALPGVLGVALAARDGAGLRVVLMGAWLLAATAAAGLTGGVTGAVPGLVLLPLAAGIALDHPRVGDDRLTRAGVVGAALPLLSGLISTWINPTSSAPGLATVSGLLVLIALLAALRLAWRARQGRLKAAEAETARLTALMGAQPGLTLVLDGAGRALAHWGAAPPAVSVSALSDQGLVSTVHAPERPAVTAALSRALAGQATEILFTPRTALDRRVVLVLRRFARPDAPVRLIAQAFDGTAQFARELRLENARAEAEAQSAGKTRFLANMSHELRTPLNAVLGFADIMRQRLFGPLPDRYADYAESIHQAGGHLLDLINDVLDMAKIEAERYQLAQTDFDARDAVSAAVALLRLQADDKGVHLAAVLPTQALPVHADPRALKQIALNLLSNAVKFTPAGGSVTATLDGVGPDLELAVSDTGVGIAPEDLQRLGRPFEQAGGADQRAQGTGLGLSLVRSLTELHGGRMTIDSTLGEGTAIVVRLPVRSPPALPFEPAEEEAGLPGPVPV
ncbi:HAMP domain-containing sensor histidine kinase [Brevundimonas sp. SORGH_AS_0993]|uniref:sensor histidine kinase n=1 Tax=Brevundimonas sp. SORGH_AS_0993 TaxID=3041794 RepID=UPI00278904F4|nr:HAMP domain-containing sensor histidine kinase [Brevundimonas sp. SORGH_AS_0993]MDQ1155368.1 cell cycle sensor histidine kinase DivJ [Brevundimonas sp. SORGH_AS_0993]